MTQAAENLNRRVLVLAGPIMIANLSVPLLGAVDTAVMGHLPEAKYLGAVAVGAVIFNFIYWGFGFLRMGTTGLTAQAFGSDDRAELSAILARALLLAVALGAALWVLQYPLRLGALALFRANADVEALAGTYFHIRIWSAPAALINYGLIGWFIGMQDTRRPMALQIGMNGLNIALDLTFVLGFGWGVAGVAAATAIAEYAAAAIGLVMAARQLRRIGTAAAWRAGLFDAAKMRRLIAVNRDIFIRTLCLMLAFAILTSEAGRLGTVALAANAVLLQFQHFLSFGLDGFAHAAEALVGGALGAGNRERLRATVVTAGKWSVGIAALYAVFYWAAGPSIIGVLTDIETVRAAAGGLLIWVVISPLVSVWSFLLDGIFIGATHTREMRNGMAVSLAVFVAAVFALEPAFGLAGLWAAMMLFFAARGITLAVFYPRIERAALAANQAATH